MDMYCSMKDMSGKVKQDQDTLGYVRITQDILAGYPGRIRSKDKCPILQTSSPWAQTYPTYPDLS